MDVATLLESTLTLAMVVDESSTAYKVGNALAYAFIVIFAFAILRKFLRKR